MVKLKQDRSKISVNFFGYLQNAIKYLNLYVVILLMIMSLVAGFYLSALISNNHELKVKARDFVGSLNYNANKFLPYFGPEIKKIAIDIKHKNMQKIAYQRNRALRKGSNTTTSDDYVPAKIIIDNKSQKVKLRLKGVFKDHWQNADKWSLKVKAKKPVMDMTKFSFIMPRAREFIHEWIYIKLLEYEGLIARKIDYVSVSINGKDNGLYIIEEDPSPYLLKRNGLVPGPIVGYSKDVYVREQIRRGHGSRSSMPVGAGFQARVIDSSGSSKVERDTEQYELYQKAVAMMEAFRNHELSLEEVFDTNKLATYLAVKALCGSSEFDPNDTKFYFNPVTSKLEPLGAEIHHKKRRVADWWVNAEDSDRSLFVDLFLGNMEFFAKYVKELERVSKKEYLDKFFKLYKEPISQISMVLQGHYKGFTFTKDDYYVNQSFMNRTLHPIKGVMAYFYDIDGKAISAHLANTEAVPMEILSLSLKNNGEETVLKPISKEAVLLKSKRKNDLMQYSKIFFRLPSSVNWNPKWADDLFVNYKVIGTDNIKSTPVAKWKYLSKDKLLDSLKSTVYKSNIGEFGFLKLNEARKEITVSPGEWNLTKTLFVPRGYKLVALGGSTLNFMNSSSIISYSPIYFEGTESNPVILQAGDDQKGGGIAVIGTEEKSYMQHVIVEGLSKPVFDGLISFDAAINFYESEVEIRDSEFEDIESAESISITRSHFKILKCEFEETESAFLDIRFSRGLIAESNFSESSQDAINILGSFIRVKSSSISDIKNTAIVSKSYGSAILKDVNISKVKQAIISSDSSLTALENCLIKEAKVGLIALNRTNDFALSTIRANKLLSEKVDLPYLLQKGSTLSINKKPQKPNFKKHKKMAKALKESL